MEKLPQSKRDRGDITTKCNVVPALGTDRSRKGASGVHCNNKAVCVWVCVGFCWVSDLHLPLGLLGEALTFVVQVLSCSVGMMKLVSRGPWREFSKLSVCGKYCVRCVSLGSLMVVSLQLCGCAGGVVLQSDWLDSPSFSVPQFPSL